MRTGYRVRDGCRPHRLLIGIGLVSLLVAAVSPVAAREPGEETTARVRVYEANLRADCGARHQVVAGLAVGDEVAVLERLDGWSRVRHAASGVEGCVLASDLKQAVSFLQQGLEQSETMLEMVDELLTAWPVGGVDPFEELVRISFEDHPDMHERFLAARNRAWVEPIEALLARSSPILVVVGAGHLVGEGSVVELLRRRGYCVERVTPESVAEPALTAAALCN